jgi:hypothetical protein
LRAPLLVKERRVFLLADIKNWTEANIEAVLAAQNAYDKAQEAPGEARGPARGAPGLTRPPISPTGAPPGTLVAAHS